MKIIDGEFTEGCAYTANTLTLWGQAIVLGASSSLTFRGFILRDKKGTHWAKLRQIAIVFIVYRHNLSPYAVSYVQTSMQSTDIVAKIAVWLQ